MTKHAFSLDFGTSTLQWARIDIAPGADPNLSSQDSMPNVLQLKDGQLAAIGADAAQATFAYLDRTYGEYKMHLAGDDGAPWTRDVEPGRLAELAMGWLLGDPRGLPGMGYQPTDPLVVGAPGHWEANGRGRAALLQSARAAEAESVHVLHEPYAALLSWLQQADGVQELPEGKFNLVYDFGGGTLDIALLAGAAGSDKLLHGAHVLGGKDFDIRLCEHFEADLAAGASGRLSLADRIVLRRGVKTLKERLGRSPEAGVAISKMAIAPRGVDLDLTRSEFEDVCGDLIRTASAVIGETLGRNEVNPQQIGRVLLTGGSSQMWWVREQLREALPHLNEQDIAISPQPQHDVARGAALFGAGYYQETSRLSIPKASPSDDAIEELVMKYAVGAGVAVAVNPIPFLDVAAGVGLNWKMIIDVAAEYGRSFGESEAQALGEEILRGFTAMGVVYVISAFLKITIIGAVLQAGIAGYFTYMTGLAAREYFKRGASWGAEGAQEVLGRLKEEHPPIQTIRRIAKLIQRERRG